MTYRSYPGAPLDGYVIEHWGYPQTLMMYDIARVAADVRRQFQLQQQ